MTVRRGKRRLAALALVGAVAPWAVPGTAWAAPPARTPAWCAHHPKAAARIAACHPTSGGGSGNGGGQAPMTVQVDPDPLVETGPGLLVAVIQVESSPSFAGDAVTVDSSQLQAACGGAIFFLDLQNGATTAAPGIGIDSVPAVLDADGNATVVVDSQGCAPGASVVEAVLDVAPFLTAQAIVTVSPPSLTPAGLNGYPATSGRTVGEVETGDTPTSGDSDVYAVFSVEGDPVDAEQPVEIGSAQLDGRCAGGWFWGGTDGSINGTGVATAPLPSTLDDDGNAVFLFMGSSCAPGPSQVVADVLAGTGPTYTTTFVVSPPAPTT